MLQLPLAPDVGARLLLLAARQAGTLVSLGDLPGHEFHGNQWTGGGVESVIQSSKAEDKLVAIQNYTGDSAPINVALRSGEAPPKGYLGTTKALDAAIKASPLQPDNGIDELFTRIVPPEVADAWKDGATVTDQGFVSLSEDPSFHANMLEELGERPDGEFAAYKSVYVSVPKGIGALYVNDHLNSRHHFAWQKEVILGRGHSFKVSRDQGDVYLELVK